MRHDDAYLLDMLLAVREAGTFTAGLTFPEFKRNRMAQLAILKAVEVVGEAASHVSTEGKRRRSDRRVRTDSRLSRLRKIEG